MPPIQLFPLNHKSILTNDAPVNTFRKKEADVTEISYIRSKWSVRPIKMFAKTLYLQGFAGQRRLFFLFFGWDLADFLPKGDFSVRPKKISAYSYFFSF